MADTDRHEPQIYQLRAVLRGSSPLIWRRLLVRSDSAVAKLHEVLQVAFAWGDEHLNRFEIRGREYAVYCDGGGMIGIDAKDVRLRDLKLRRLERLVPPGIERRHFRSLTRESWLALLLECVDPFFTVAEAGVEHCQ
jgi:hypothetical protein